ncbi:phosphate/phosphoenolpyruvate translocator protein [Scenedesmus sp. NREL 46B-D3]|nr:phosphate/phosphoenolpyruvate translocator protein [Scenedesmus sp. NREL 46B-D3]
MEQGSSQKAGLHSLISAYGCMALWILLSAVVIMLNKYILDPSLGGFPFPLALTASHMLFCSLLAWLLVRTGLVEAPELHMDIWTRCVLPVGALFAATLWMGNAAYLYLSVSFIQMMKAVMPLLVYAVGTLLGTEVFCRRTGGILFVVVTGVLIASYGEVVFVWAGIIFQIASMLSEATRLTLVQLLLQSKGIKLNPITSLYYIAPVCLVCLLAPLALLETEELFQHEWKIHPGLILLSATAAFALNCSVFLLIGKTSALTMNLAGVAKDVMLIYLSMTLYGSTVTELQVLGYGMALCGAFYYNYQKIIARTPTVATVAHAADGTKGEREALKACTESSINSQQAGKVGDSVVGSNHDDLELVLQQQKPHSQPSVQRCDAGA